MNMLNIIMLDNMLFK